MENFQLYEKQLNASLDKLSSVDADFARALDEVGYPCERTNTQGFDVFVGIIVSQQLSTKAASTIKARVVEAAGGVLKPESLQALSDEQLRGCGLSFQKIRYVRHLCEKVLDGSFEPELLLNLDNEQVLSSVTSLLGFGRWSAEMYLLFSLGRADVWPAGDLAVQEAVKRLKKLDERPDPKEMDVLAEGWRPYRSSAAIFLWHYYANTPEL